MEYSFGFYREMAPDWLDFCVRSAGHEPARKGGKFRYLELGCGQGFGLCLLAAANPAAEFVGVDFQPEHVLHARDLAARAGLNNVRFIDADFADLALEWPGEIGSFDYVTLHGILSWVSAKLRDAVFQCIAHATHSGSLVYVSYNAQPSWLGMAPFQHIASLLKKGSGKPGAEIIDESIALFERMRSGNAAGFQLLPALDLRLRTLRSHKVNYLVHEYLNENWHPFWHSEVASLFRPAGLHFAGSATIADNLLPEVLQPSLRAPIEDQSSPDLRQDLQDFAVSQGFRRDIFIRGNISPPTERTAALKDTILCLLPRPDAGQAVTVQTSFGELTLSPESISPIIEALQERPQSIRELGERSGSAGESFFQILLLLLQTDMIGIVASNPAGSAMAERLNARIASAACAGTPYEQLAAAALGSAVRVSRIELQLLDSWIQSPDKNDLDAIANALSARLSSAGQKLHLHGRVVSDSEAAEQCRSVTRIFLSELLPRWRRLGVIDANP